MSFYIEISFILYSYSFFPQKEYDVYTICLLLFMTEIYTREYKQKCELDDL